MKKLTHYIGIVAFILLICSNTYGQQKIKDRSAMELSAESNGLSFWEKAEFRLKSNAAYLIATVANIGTELKVGRQLSIDIPLLYSPYNISSTKKIKVLAFQPELRYWFKQQYAGHFVGAHINLAWYNTAGIFGNKDIRYQDSGDKPLWGLGFSYGYAILLNDDFSVEFTMGLGYARLCYNTYYNIDNGSKIATALTKNYWGITRLGVSFSYKL